MVESCKDIQGYLTIIEGNNVRNPNIIDENINQSINNMLDKEYLFENGTRWAKIIDCDDENLKIEHGFREYEADSVGYITIYEMNRMISVGDMVLFEEVDSIDDILLESCDDNDFIEFIERVDRYLLVNENKESIELEYSWSEAWTDGKTPIEAAEEAVILNN